MENKELNIEIKNEHYFDKIETLINCIRLYKDDTVQFVVYKNSRVVICSNTKIYTYDNSLVFAYNQSVVCAFNSSRIHAKDNVIVNAYDNSTITAFANSSVYSFDTVTVFANGNSSVYANINSVVYAYHCSKVYTCNNSIAYTKDNSIIYAYDNSKVDAYDSSTIYAYDKSKIDAYEFSTLYIYNLKVTVNAINHFGSIIKQVHKVKKDILVYKKLKDDKIATLKLVKGQTFQSKHFCKCRTDKALVISITNIENTEEYYDGVSVHDNNFKYVVGKNITADRYDENIDECSNGIHFFLTREKAEKYEL